MITLKGKYNEAKVFTDNPDDTTVEQVINLCNQKIYEGNKIRIMPDCHAGKNCTIGTTMKIKDKVSPNLVGVDIGCGMLVVNLFDKNIDLEKLDNFIKENIPNGRNVHLNAKNDEVLDMLQNLVCKDHIDINRSINSVGTLGGGNHFIEIDENDSGDRYLIIHSGSRHLGVQVANYYQEKGYEKINNNQAEKDEIIKRLKREGRQKEIQSELNKVKSVNINKDEAYVEGKDFYNYIYDMKIVQKYASINRYKIAEDILKFLNLSLSKTHHFEVIHNYLDIRDKNDIILRKGAISANKDEYVLIPLNMRDGCILGKGKGNDDWNCSAPHGSGRVLSRTKAKESISIDEFSESMKNVFTTCVNMSTLDEAPQAYKPSNEIISNIQDAVDIVSILHPIYNFKSC